MMPVTSVAGGQRRFGAIRWYGFRNGAVGLILGGSTGGALTGSALTRGALRLRVGGAEHAAHVA
jgi:hypothetical protein